MSNIAMLCESKELPYAQFIQAVEEFVDEVSHNPPTIELYNATAKRLLGEQLTHDEIMLGVPVCSPRDLIVLDERSNHIQVSTDTQIRGWLMRMKIGRNGLQKIYSYYQKLKADSPKDTDSFIMAKVAQQFGLPARDFQVMFTKFMAKNNLKEYYYNLAEEALQEEAPVNTQSSTLPDRDASDGKPSESGVKKRKKLSDIINK